MVIDMPVNEDREYVGHRAEEGLTLVIDLELDFLKSLMSACFWVICILFSI